METKHTQLPWHLECDYTSIVSDVTPDNGGDIVCLCPDMEDSFQNWKNGTAEFIVRACNSHYELVRALRGVIHHNNAIKPQFKLPDSLIEQVESVLNEATGQA